MMATEQPAGTLAETLRVAAMRVEALPADVPTPSDVSVRAGRIRASWDDVTVDQARAIVAASGTDQWRDGGRYLFAITDDDLIALWMVYPAEVATPAFAFSLADVTS